MMRPLVALALSMMVLESKGLMVNGSITRMLILSVKENGEDSWVGVFTHPKYKTKFSVRTFFQMFGSRQSLVEGHPRANDGHVVVIGFVHNLRWKGRLKH